MYPFPSLSLSKKNQFQVVESHVILSNVVHTFQAYKINLSICPGGNSTISIFGNGCMGLSLVLASVGMEVGGGGGGVVLVELGMF